MDAAHVLAHLHPLPGSHAALCPSGQAGHQRPLCGTLPENALSAAHTGDRLSLPGKKASAPLKPVPCCNHITQSLNCTTWLHQRLTHGLHPVPALPYLHSLPAAQTASRAASRAAPAAASVAVSKAVSGAVSRTVFRTALSDSFPDSIPTGSKAAYQQHTSSIPGGSDGRQGTHTPKKSIEPQGRQHSLQRSTPRYTGKKL